MSKPVILMADDDRALLEAVSTRLSAAGFEVHSVQDGYMAVQTARRVRPDVVLLDVGMPAGDGFSVQDRLQTLETRDMPQFVYMTGSREGRVTQEARAKHAFALVHKPFDGRELAVVLRSAVRQRRARQRALADRERAREHGEDLGDWAT
ncbi:MAG: response regulator [Phycisphaerales bacterium]